MSPQFLTIALSGLLAAVAPADDPTKNDTEKLQGTWVVESLAEDGKDEGKSKGNKLVFAAGKLTLKRKPGQKDFEGKYEVVDAAKRPKSINVTLKKAQMLGIYEFDGKRLRLCLGEPGKGRPSAFKATPDWILIVLTREEP